MRQNVALTSCAKSADGWSASGTAVTGSVAASYTITIYFVTVPGDTVEGEGKTTVQVPAGGTSKWTVDGKFTPTGPMQCVLRGVG